MRDKGNLDILIKDESLEDSAQSPATGRHAVDIVEDLEAALQQFVAVANDLKESS